MSQALSTQSIDARTGLCYARSMANVSTKKLRALIVEIDREARDVRYRPAQLWHALVRMAEWDAFSTADVRVLTSPAAASRLLRAMVSAGVLHASGERRFRRYGWTRRKAERCAAAARAGIEAPRWAE